MPHCRAQAWRHRGSSAQEGLWGREWPVRAIPGEDLPGLGQIRGAGGVRENGGVGGPEKLGGVSGDGAEALRDPPPRLFRGEAGQLQTGLRREPSSSHFLEGAAGPANAG